MCYLHFLLVAASDNNSHRDVDICDMQTVFSWTTIHSGGIQATYKFSWNATCVFKTWSACGNQCFLPIMCDRGMVAVIVGDDDDYDGDDDDGDGDVNDDRVKGDVDIVAGKRLLTVSSILL